MLKTIPITNIHNCESTPDTSVSPPQLKKVIVKHFVNFPSLAFAKWYWAQSRVAREVKSFYFMFKSNHNTSA